MGTRLPQHRAHLSGPGSEREGLIAAELVDRTGRSAGDQDGASWRCPRVDYSLTGRGRELTALLLPPMEWIVANAPGIVSPATT